MQKSAIVRVRTFKASDTEFVSSLTTRFSEFELPRWRITNEIDNKNRIALQKTMEEPEPESAIFIAEDGVDGLAGFIHLQTQTDYFSGDKHGYISDLAVDKRFEGRGVGRILLDAAQDWARAKGYHLLTLYVFAGNTRARRVYEKYGFSQEVVKYAKVIEPRP
ncbi:MAG TPA: GNAT family N-acetyltransferase [Anaerolineales bacterium]|nr:GNAT family N-acetyltransferase [Anaerolineales bacterium]